MSAASLRPSTDERTSARLARQARKDTAPELQLRRELHRRGLRYRVEYPVPGMPRRRMDVAFTRTKIAVFVDGCFWHACPIHGANPVNNGAWWAAKLRRNMERDRETDGHLRTMGWTIVRVWEHEDVVVAVERVERAVGRPRSPRVVDDADAAEDQAPAAAVPSSS